MNKRPNIFRRLLCSVSIHDWRTWEEAVRLGTTEACKYCVGWRFVPPLNPPAQPEEAA